MILTWLGSRECEVRESEGGDVVLALRFAEGGMYWETQAWPNDFNTPDDKWFYVDLEDGDARSRLQSDRERVAMAPAGGVQAALLQEFQGRVEQYVTETRDLAIKAATRRAERAVRWRRENR